MTSTIQKIAEIAKRIESLDNETSNVDKRIAKTCIISGRCIKSLLEMGGCSVTENSYMSSNFKTSVRRSNYRV